LYKSSALRRIPSPLINHTGLNTMSLQAVKQTYEKLGRDDPLYAVLSDKRFQHNRWAPHAFFETGAKEIDEVLRYVQDVGCKLEFHRALDFGCGVGRLSQALAEHFQSVVGVDIAESMVQRAREFNRFGDRVVYLANVTDDLRMLDSDSFDLVYSNITLQHIPPEHGKNYIREFLRVLRPGGLALFQVPSGQPYRPGSFGEFLYYLRRRYLRRLWRALRRRPQVEIHYIPRAEVESLLRAAGGVLVDVVPAWRTGPRGKNFRYCVAKDTA
jgi:SAM-dependent methyltransferase